MPSTSIAPSYTPRHKSEISRVVFTKKFLDALSPASSASAQWTWHYDIQVPGLAVGVGPSGIKSFYLIRKVNRQSRRFLLGKYPVGQDAAHASPHISRIDHCMALPG